MIIALAGNQNCGKTTLFNRLTGASQRVGNWPGVTVERKEGRIRTASDITLVDLPGIYSLSSYSMEERVTRDYLTGEEPQGIVNIVDATNLERNLYLTLQLCELGKPMVIALNMIDELRARGDILRIETLSRELGIPIVPVAARNGEGLDKLVRTVISTVRDGKPPTLRQYDGSDSPYESAAARYRYIDWVTGKVHTRKNNGDTYSRKIDRILTGKWTAFPCFVLILSLIFWLTFGPLGMYISESAAGVLNRWCDVAALRLERWGVDAWLRGLIVDGGLAGVCSMLGFLPMLLILFFFLSLLEDSGYMARVAFITDRLLARFGLSGRVFFPLITGFGCSVPAIMAARCATCAEERRLTVLITPFFSCGARIPIYGVFCAAFFPGKEFAVMLLLYLLGVVVALLSAFFLKDISAFKAKDVPFVMELPPYRLPSARVVIRLLWDKGADFVRRACTVILAATVLIWFLQYFTPALQPAENSGESLLAVIGGIIAPVFAPLGFGTWQAATALLAGFAAKEAVVSSLAVLYAAGTEGLPDALGTAAGFSPASALSFMVFCLLYMPCVAAFAAMKRELGGLGRAVTAALYQTGAAWILSFIVYHLARLFFA